jgi:hypothetical protein
LACGTEAVSPSTVAEPITGKLEAEHHLPGSAITPLEQFDVSWRNL